MGLFRPEKKAQTWPRFGPGGTHDHHRAAAHFFATFRRGPRNGPVRPPGPESDKPAKIIWHFQYQIDPKSKNRAFRQKWAKSRPNKNTARSVLGRFPPLRASRAPTGRNGPFRPPRPESEKPPKTIWDFQCQIHPKSQNRASGPKWAKLATGRAKPRAPRCAGSGPLGRAAGFAEKDKNPGKKTENENHMECPVPNRHQIPQRSLRATRGPKRARAWGHCAVCAAPVPAPEGVEGLKRALPPPFPPPRPQSEKAARNIFGVPLPQQVPASSSFSHGAGTGFIVVLPRAGPCNPEHRC